jgi:hypothetical protein
MIRWDKDNDKIKMITEWDNNDDKKSGTDNGLSYGKDWTRPF